jgi:hypothetical protein
MYRQNKSIILKVRSSRTTRPLKLTGLSANLIIIDDYINKQNDTIR